jgi:glycosyltransferase involved in cell wall biosynthesis
MKIIHVIPNLQRGGAERICINICNELKNQGHDVLLILFSNENEYRELTSQLNIKVIPSSFTPSILKRNLVNIDELEKSISEFKPDIIHSHLYEADLIVYQLKEKKAKFLSHIHSNRKELKNNPKGINFKQQIIFSFEKKIYLNLLKRKKAHLIAISRDCYDFAAEDLRQKKTDVTFLPNCIDYNLFKSQPKTGSIEEPFKLITVGRFVPKKAQEFLIEVALKLKDKGVNFALDLLGDGPKRNSVEELSIEYNLQNQVNFKGIVKNPELHLKSADLYVHSSKDEPFGLVLIEAMASGLPIVTTDGGGNRDIIIENENGFMIESRNPELFANKIIQLMNSQKDYERISENCINFASNYDVKNYVITLLNLYN